MKKSPETNLELSAWIRLLKAHNLIVRQSRARLAAQCTMAQFDVLAQLSRNSKGTTLAELSRHLLVTAGNITGLIDRMEEAALVSRKPDAEDRRITRVHLTGKGKQLAKNVIPTHSEDIREMFSSLSRKEVSQLHSLLEKLIGGLES